MARENNKEFLTSYSNIMTEWQLVEFDFIRY